MKLTNAYIRYRGHRYFKPVACNKLTSPTHTQFFDLSCILATYNETINMAIIAV